MVIIKISATKKLLLEMSAKQIMFMIEKYGTRIFRRKGMLIEQGMHWILALPEEVESMELSEKYQIGTVIDGKVI